MIIGNKALGPLLFILLSACSTVSYQEPQTGPRARVRFVTDTHVASVLRSYDDAGCKTNETEIMRLRTGYVANPIPKRLDLPLWDFNPSAAKEVYIDANRPTQFLFSSESLVAHPPNIMTTLKCGVSFSFPFEAEKDYEVVFNWDPQQCRVVVNELRGRGNSAARVKLAIIDNSLTGETKSCLNPLKKARWY